MINKGEKKTTREKLPEVLQEMMEGIHKCFGGTGKVDMCMIADDKMLDNLDKKDLYKKLKRIIINKVRQRE